MLYLVISLGRRLICKPGSRLLVLDHDDYLDFQKLHADEQKRHACFPVYPELVLEFIPPPLLTNQTPPSPAVSLYTFHHPFGTSVRQATNNLPDICPPTLAFTITPSLL